MPECFKVKETQGTPPISPACYVPVLRNLYYQFNGLSRSGHKGIRATLVHFHSSCSVSTNWTCPPSKQIQNLAFCPYHHHSNPRCHGSSLDFCSILPWVFLFPVSAPQVCFRSSYRDALRVNVRSCHFSAQNSPKAPCVTQVMFLVESHRALTGSSTYSLLEVNSPTPSLVSTLIHVFLVPHSFPLCSNLRGFCCCCCAS